MQTHPASYRDRDGFVFQQEGKIYRYVNPRYNEQYDKLMNSGLYDALVKKQWLIAHTTIEDLSRFGFSEGKVLFPDQIPFISYPYEWSFDMWRDAALLTLQITTATLQKGMILKDATPFNVQFYRGRPVFIDTLSFYDYVEGESWVAYRQFCECFLAPLLLMHYGHPELGKWFRVYPNGIPMALLANMLPKRSMWNLNTLLHVHLQAKLSAGQQKKRGAENKFTKHKMEVLLQGLERFVRQLKPRKSKTTWDDYYTGTILGADYLEAKTALVKSFISGIEYTNVIDLGANDGHFSFLFTEDKNIVAIDFDMNCVNNLYQKIKKAGKTNMLPLVNDLAAPSPAIGWNNTERESLTGRLKADLVMALALLHHLAIANNIPLTLLADWLQPMGEYLIIEFVPKEDEKVKLLLQHRKDVFDNYNREHFKSAFARHYEIMREEKVGKSERALFLMKRRG
ncbi:MAG: hypothetical protein WAU23_01140 [Ferruginibacter sp.]